MELPQTLNQAIEMLEKSNAENAVLKTEVDAFNALTAEHNLLITQRDDLNAKVQELSAQIENFTIENKELKEKAQSVDEKLADVLAGLAVSPAKISESNPSQKLSAREQLAQISDPAARGKFRVEHFDDLLKNK
jgi:uncharacterized coiled-coil DUF342 family protein